MNRFFRSSIAYVLLLLSIFFPSQAFAGLGVSPAGVVVDRALNEISQVHTVKVLRDYSIHREATVFVEYRGEFAEYLDGPTELFFPAGEDRVDFTFSLQPSQLPNGLYNAQIVFLPSLDDIADVSGEGGSAVAVRAGTSLGVAFTVSDEQVVAFDIQNVVVHDAEVGMELGVQFLLINLGNVVWRPDSVTYSVLDARGEIVYAETRRGETLAFVPPGANTEELVLLQPNLIPGEYVLRSEFFYEGRVVRTFDTPFSMLPVGTLPQLGVLRSFSTNKDNYFPGENAKLVGLFENTGQVAYQATFVAELFLNDALIDVLVSAPQRVEMNSSTTFDLFTSFEEPGDYLMNAYVEYGQKRTESIVKRVSVARGEGGVTRLIPYFFVAFLLAGLFFFFIAYMRRKRPGPPTIVGPVTVVSMAVSGTSPHEDDSSVEVFMNGVKIGSASVAANVWTMPVATGVLAAGNQLKAIARVDSNHDGAITEKDRTSVESNAVLIEAAPPETSASTVFPVPGTQISGAPAAPPSAPTPVPTTPVTSAPVSEETAPSHDDLWTISL